MYYVILLFGMMRRGPKNSWAIICVNNNNLFSSMNYKWVLCNLRELVEDGTPPYEIGVVRSGPPPVALGNAFLLVTSFGARQRDHVPFFGPIYMVT